MAWHRSTLVLVLVTACAPHAPPLAHRATPVTCAPSTTANPPLACATDADCTVVAGMTRFCVHGACAFDGCLSDADCAAGQACTCAGTSFGWSHVPLGAHCVSAGCRVDADCGTNGYCSPSTTPMGSFYGVSVIECHTSMDSCTNDSDCGGDGAWSAPYCAYSAGTWSCSMGSIAG